MDAAVSHLHRDLRQALVSDLLLTEPACVPGWFGVAPRCQHKSMDATMSTQPRRNTVAGVGELLWDLLPDGKQLGGGSGSGYRGD
jgi:hypothetical protein